MTTRRQEIFQQQNLDQLVPNNPYMLLFKKDDWKEYLELTAQIYDLLEEDGTRVSHDEVNVLLESYYADSPSAFVGQKKGQFLHMAIAELGVLKDSYDAMGERYIEATREGKALLKLSENLLVQKRQFTGTGADTLLGALNNLLLNESPMSQEEALKHHQAQIKAYKEDMERIREHGVQAGELLNHGFSNQELFSQADEAASHILSASEDIKLAIENTRKDLVRSYQQRELSAGEAIEYVADFYASLQTTPEYMSYVKAKDLLSFIEGLGGQFQHKDVTQIFYNLRQHNTVEESLLRRSSLADFSRQFQNIVHSIDEKIYEQVNILQVQIHYVLSGYSRRTQARLNDLMARLTTNSSRVPEFFKGACLEGQLGLSVDLGPVDLNDLETTEKAGGLTPEAEKMESLEIAEMMEILKKSEEATIERVLERLRAHLSRYGEAVLDQYPFAHGILEYYVLACLGAFTEDIRSEPLEKTDLHLPLNDGAVVLPNIDNQRFVFAE